MAKSKQAVIQIETSNAQKSLNDLKKQINEAKNALFEMTEGTDEYNAKIQELGLAQSELTSFMNKTRQGCSALEGSYNALSYQMSALKQAYHETNDEMTRSQLAEQINSINDKLKEMDEAVGNHSRNVGNYTKSMTEAFQNVGLTIGNINPLFANLANGMMQAGEKGSTAFAGLGAAAKGLGTQLKALAANPVGAIIMAIVIAVKAAVAIFNKFKESINRNEEASNNLKKALAPINAIVNGITNAFDSFVEVLTKGAAAVGNFVSEIMKWMGINDKRVKDEQSIAEMEINNAKLKRDYVVQNSELELEASEARAKAAEKDKYTAQERIAFLQEYKSKQDQIAKNNLDMAQKELVLLQKQAAQGKNNAQINDKIAEAKAKVNQVQQAYNEKIRETNSQMSELNNQLKREAEEEHKKAEEAAKKHADELKRLKDEYKGLIQTFDDFLKEGDLNYQISKLTQQQGEYINKLNDQYKKNAITKKEYDQAKYKSESWLYKQTLKLQEQAAQKQQEAMDHYLALVGSSTLAAIKQVEFEMDKELLALQDLNIDDDTYMQMADNIRKAYADKIQKTKNELYTKDAQEQLSIQMAADELMYNNAEAMLRKSLATRQISLKEYLEETFELQQQDLEKQINVQTAYLDEIGSLYETGNIDLQTYNQLVMETETLILDLQAQVEENIKTHAEQLRDETLQTFTEMSDLMAEYISNMAELGDGLSSQWANVFSTISDGITKVGEQLKSGESAWKSYASIATASLNVAASMMSALASEQDEATKEGFETQKKYQTAGAIISMLSGIVSAWSSSMNLKFPINILVGTILSALMGTIGGIQIAKIQSTNFGDQNKTSANTALPNTNALQNLQAPVQWSSMVQGASAEEQITDTRVYVVESDITDVTQKVNVAENESRY